MTFTIAPPGERAVDVTSERILQEWRTAAGAVPGAESLHFRASRGDGGAPIHVELTGPDPRRLAERAQAVKEALWRYPGVLDVRDSFDRGKDELSISVRPAAERLGVSPAHLARQVRHAFFGEEAQRIQRGRDEVRVMVRYPQAERASIESLRSLHIRTPEGASVPLGDLVDVRMGRAEHEILRVDRRRVVAVTAGVDRERADVGAVKREVAALLDSQRGRWPDVRWSFEGEAREQRETSASLVAGLAFVLFAVYAMLAIPFRSYLQPLVVMSVLPFGGGRRHPGTPWSWTSRCRSPPWSACSHSPGSW